MSYTRYFKNKDTGLELEFDSSDVLTYIDETGDRDLFEDGFLIQLPFNEWEEVYRG